MSSIKNPVAKKLLSLDRDHYSKAEYDKGRKSWRKKEKRLEHSYRHQSKAKLGQKGDGEEAIAGLAKRKAKKWPVAPLRLTIAGKLERRARSVGAKVARAMKQTRIVAGR